MADSLTLARLNPIVGGGIARRSVGRGVGASAAAFTGGPVR
jgi:hypothetical protein